MANKIRLGFVGANVRSHWASQPHFPALQIPPWRQAWPQVPQFSASVAVGISQPSAGFRLQSAYQGRHPAMLQIPPAQTAVAWG